MLRALVVVLLLANAGFLAWSQGWLDAYVSVRALGEREPERLQRQLRPETLRLLPASAASAALAAATAGAHLTSCLEAGPFDAAGVAAAEQALAALPAGSWARISSERPGSWAVYMGRFAEREGLQKKEDELRRLRLSYEEVTAPPELAPGLSLGRFGSPQAAEAALAGFTQRGVRTARVAQLAAPAPQHALRVEQADAALAAQLAMLHDPALGEGFRPCAGR